MPALLPLLQLCQSFICKQVWTGFRLALPLLSLWPVCIAEESHSAMKPLWADSAEENQQDPWEQGHNILFWGGEVSLTGKMSLVTPYLKILKNSLKLKNFKTDVFKYSSKTWKRHY